MKNINSGTPINTGKTRLELDIIQGLTKRELFAAMAMQGLLAIPENYNPAQTAVWHADELIKALEAIDE